MLFFSENVVCPCTHTHDSLEVFSILTAFPCDFGEVALTVPPLFLYKMRTVVFPFLDLFWTGCFLVQVCYVKPGFITNLCLLHVSLGAGTGTQPPLLPGWARGDVTKGGSRHVCPHICAQAECQQLQPGHSQVSKLALGYVKHQLRTA